MSSTIHVYLSDLENLFSIIGSADRDLLREIGVRPGSEFRESLDEEDDEEEEYLPDDEDEEEIEDEEAQLEDWDYEEDDADTAREALTKMIMAGVPSDLSETEAAAIEDFMASYAIGHDIAQPVEPDDVVEAADAEDDELLAESIRVNLANGLDSEEMTAFVEWLQDNEASNELIARIQMLAFGRLPESDEPAFLEPDGNFAMRSGYLYQEEIVQVFDELSDLADSVAEEAGAVPQVLAALFHYCNINSRGLFVTISE